MPHQTPAHLAQLPAYDPKTGELTAVIETPKGSRNKFDYDPSYAALQRRRHQPIPRQGAWLGQVVRGYFAYHAVPTNIRALQTFRDCVMDLWRRSLRRRGQRDKTTWQRITRLADNYLPRPRILHPWPDTPGLSNASPSNIQGGSRMRECRSYGSVRGACGNARPYRD